jgi:galactokinase
MDLISTFEKLYSRLPVLKACAPGRVNLLGEHVDYNDGPVLPAAIDRSVRLAAAPNSDSVVSLYAKDLDAQVSFSLDALKDKKDLQGQSLPSWALYPAGVAWALQEAGFKISGAQVVYTSDVPIGSGLSSSAAVEVGFAVLWQALNGWNADRMMLAQLCQRAENVYVGLSCGLMDQFASAHGVEGHALYFDTRSLEWQPVPLPAGSSIVVADSGVRRSLASSAYNERRSSCEEAVNILRQFMPGILSLRDVLPTEFAAYSDQLPPVVRKRAEHVVKEIARVETALTALRRSDAQTFGALMFAGHASLRDLYEVSIPELDALVSIARGLPGCLGARLTGAGFGGCTVNLVEESKAKEFIEGLQAGYHQATGRQAQVYLCRASQGATVAEAQQRP